jgi:hypothetical protein
MCALRAQPFPCCALKSLEILTCVTTRLNRSVRHIQVEVVSVFGQCGVEHARDDATKSSDASISGRRFLRRFWWSGIADRERGIAGKPVAQAPAPARNRLRWRVLRGTQMRSILVVVEHALSHEVPSETIRAEIATRILSQHPASSSFPSHSIRERGCDERYAKPPSATNRGHTMYRNWNRYVHS